MRGVPYTSCVLNCLTWSWENDELQPEDTVGGFIRTTGGSVYKIDDVRKRPIAAGWRFAVTRWPADEVPDDALIVDFQWAKR